jgi:hypothetical protein
MTKQRAADKNVQNVAEDLAQAPINSHHAQQLQQDTNDRRHQDALNHDTGHNKTFTSKGE